MKLVWSRLALRDVQRRVIYIRQFNELAAQREGESLFLIGEKLKVAPNIGRHGRRAGTMEYVGLEPYVVVYRVTDSTVRIIRVWHGAQLKERY